MALEIASAERPGTREFVRFELRWARDTAAAADAAQDRNGGGLHGTAPRPRDVFSCVRCAVELPPPGHRDMVDGKITIRSVRAAIFERLQTVAEAALDVDGHALPDAVVAAAASLQGRLNSVDDVVLLAPVAVRDGSDIAATPLSDFMTVGNAVPPACRVQFPQGVSRYDDLWPAKLGSASGALLEAPAEAPLAAVVSTSSVHAPYEYVEARIDAALGATPQVRALSSALLVRLRSEVQPLLIYDPMVIARAFAGTQAANELRRLLDEAAAREAEAREVAAFPALGGDEIPSDPAELVRRSYEDLRKLNAPAAAERAAVADAESHRVGDTAGPVTIAAPSGTGEDVVVDHQQAALQEWASRYGSPSWWRLARADGSDGLIQRHERTRHDEQPKLRATHMKTEFVFEHDTTGEVLLTTLSDVPRPSAFTARSVESLLRHLDMYAELAAEECRLTAVDTVLSKTTFKAARAEYLDVDFESFVLVTPSTVTNTVHFMTRALRVFVAVSSTKYRATIAAMDWRREQLSELPLAPFVADAAQELSRGGKPPLARPPSADGPRSPTTATQEGADGDAETAGAEAAAAALVPTESMLARMSTLARADAIAALAQLADASPAVQEELDSGRRDDDAAFLAHVMAAGLLNLASGSGSGSHEP